MITNLNHALLAGLIFALPGVAWCWILPRAPFRGESVVRALLMALPLTVLPAIALAEAGWFTPTAPWVSSLSLTGLGLAVGWRRGIRPSSWAPSLTGAGLLALLLLLPGRGAWLPGGWDPGVNINQGLLVSRTGTAHPAPTELQQTLSVTEQSLFARSVAGRREVFPGIPMDGTSGAYAPYFYRATPTLVAWLNRFAGREAALHVNYLAGGLALLFLYAWLRRLTGPLGACAGALAAGMQPIFIHHLFVPASEMLELALLAALAWIWCGPSSRGTRLAMGLVVLLAGMNRVSFLLFAALALALHSLLPTAPDSDSASRRDRWVLALALLAIWAWYGTVQSEALVKVEHLIPRLILLSGIGLGAAALASGLRLDRIAAALPFAGLLTLILYECTRNEPWQELFRNAPVWLAYTGWPVALAAGLGLGFGYARGTPAARTWLSALAALLLFMLLHKHAAHLFPWATKRWLPATFLLVGAGSAHLAESFTHSRARWLRPAGAALLACALLSQAGRANAALRSHECDGFPGALDEVAAKIAPRDVVVADHFWAGTPLALAYGKLALNGEPIWADLDEKRAGAALDALERLRASGYRILLFTSTREGAAIFPGDLAAGRLIVEWPRAEFREIIQHRSNNGFEIRLRGVTFRLYEWMGRS